MCCRYAAGDRVMEESDSNGSSSVYQSSSSSSASSSSSIASDDTVRRHGDTSHCTHVDDGDTVCTHSGTILIVHP